MAYVSSVAQTEDRPPSLRRQLLDLASEREPNVELGPARAQLDVFELELKERLAGKTDLAEKVKILGDYLFREKLLSHTADLTSPESFYVDRLLEGKTGVCLSLSAVVIVLARRLDLPAHGVAAPRHFFVRFDDGKRRINFETLEDGAEHDDAWYRARGVSKAAEAAGIYLKNLDDRETFAYLLNNDGFIRFFRGDTAGAAKRFAQALEIRPGLVEALINRGVMAGEEGDTEGAAKWFRAADAYLPDDAGLRFNVALAAMRAGRYREALAEIESALERQPDNARFDEYRYLVSATLTKPDVWQRYQKEVVANGEKLRRESKLTPGLHGEYFSDRSFKKAVFERVDRRMSFEWYRSAPDRRLPADHFAIRWQGYIDLPADGHHTIFTVTDGGVRVWVDGVRLIDNWRSNRGALDRAGLDLHAGLHEIRIDYGAWDGPAGCIVSIKKSDATNDLPASIYRHVE